jgi:FMS-like tyrosine kinase 1
MLKKTNEEQEEDEDNYLKPIDVHKKREEFVRKREAEKKKEKERSCKTLADRDSGYCNTPKGLELVDIRIEARDNKGPNWTDVVDANESPVIIRTQDNYVNIPTQKPDLRKDGPDSFLNPSYIFVKASKSDQDIL